MNKNIIVLGPPNSGKGTQAEKLTQKLNAEHFAAGELIRAEIEKKTELGETFQKYHDKGILVPGEFLDDFFAKKILEIKDKIIIFDGFPRNLSQVELLNKILPAEKLLVLEIKVSLEEMQKRMAKRRVCADCDKVFIIENNSPLKCDDCGGELVKREDDKPEVLKLRLEVYNQETKPVLDYYHQYAEVLEINGEQLIEAVEQEIWDKING